MFSCLWKANGHNFPSINQALILSHGLLSLKPVDYRIVFNFKGLSMDFQGTHHRINSTKIWSSIHAFNFFQRFLSF